MAALILSFEYDIFISYRHNDNQDGWVTDFVLNLEKELKATIKEPLSIYFDKNPHDGLLETHNVDKSLEGKLKSLVFIPIISQTYCAPKSFAWQNEFCAFNIAAHDDQFGMEILLPSGNSANRILPVRIHDIEHSDVRQIETELGTKLRSIDFVFSAAGVNRPLFAHEDHPHDNQNKTYYRDQINKVALAVKELILGMKSPQILKEIRNNPSQSSKGSKIRNRPLTVIYAALAVFIGYYVYEKIVSFKKPAVRETKDLPKSIAVLPFDNLSNDPNQEYFCDGTTAQVISSLARLKDIKVIARTSVQQYKKTTKTISQIGRELNVSHVLESAVQKSGNKIRVTAHLISVKDESPLWTEDFDNKWMSDIFEIQDEVVRKIAATLKTKLSSVEKERLVSEKSRSLEAYEHYLKGEYIHANHFGPAHLDTDFKNAEREFKTAIKLDSTFATAYAALANLYDTRRFDKGIIISDYVKLCSMYADKAYRLNPSLPYALTVKFMSWKGTSELQMDSTIRNQHYDSAYKYIMKAYENAPNAEIVSSELGAFFGYKLGLYEHGIAFLKHASEINPGSVNLPDLAYLYYYTGDLKNATACANRMLALNTKDLRSHYLLIRISCATGQIQNAERLLEEVIRINPEATRIDFLTALVAAAKGERQKALSDITKINKDAAVSIYLQLKMKHEAILAIEQAIKEFYQFDYLRLRSDRFDLLKGDPRFEKILVEQRLQYEKRLDKYGNIELPTD